MTLGHRVRTGSGALVLLGALACSTPIHTEPFRASFASPVSRIAVVPLGERPSVGSGMTAEGVRSNASSLVTARVVEALALESALEIVPPSEVELWLQTRPGPAQPRSARELVVELSGAFRIDAVISGQVTRYLERHGGARGAERPASVSFKIELHAADGTLMWRGTYTESQRGLGDDPSSLGRALERNFQFVSAESLAAYGARELVRSMGSETSLWK